MYIHYFLKYKIKKYETFKIAALALLTKFAEPPAPSIFNFKLRVLSHEFHFILNFP